jgi:predicted esterase
MARALFAVAAFAAACTGDAPPVLVARTPQPPPPASVEDPARPGRVAAPPVSPQPTEPSFSKLEVEGYLPAVVVEPPDDGRVRPLLVATHGAGGTPEAHCERWLALIGTRAFILCTRGRETDRFLPPDQRGYFYDGHVELGKEVVRAVAALEQKLGPRVDVKRATFAGFSQGASMGALFIHQSREYASMFGRVILVEGGAKEWTVSAAERLRDAGARVAIFCGQPSCDQDARHSLKWMERAALDARVFYAAGAGHTYGGEVGKQVEAAREWLFDGDPRWLPAFTADPTDQARPSHP